MHCLVSHLSAGSAAQTAPVKSSSSAPANLSPLGAGAVVSGLGQGRARARARSYQGQGQELPAGLHMGDEVDVDVCQQTFHYLNIYHGNEVTVMKRHCGATMV